MAPSRGNLGHRVRMRPPGPPASRKTAAERQTSIGTRAAPSTGMTPKIPSIAIATGLMLTLGCKDWDDPEKVEEHQEQAAEEREALQDNLERARDEDRAAAEEEIDDIEDNVEEERAEDLADDRAKVEELKSDLDEDDPKPALDGEGAGPDNAALEAIRPPSPANRDEAVEER